MILSSGHPHVFYLTIVALGYVFIIKPTFAQPLFSLQQYDIAQCDPSQTSPTITIASKSFQQNMETSNHSILVFTPFFDLQLVLDHWDDHSSHPAAVILLDAESFDKAHEHRLLSLIQQGHVLALQTSAFEDSDPEQRLLNELAVFETATGLILPFFTSLQTVNATIPLFRIDFLPTPNLTVLQDQVALDFLQKAAHTHDIRSPLDFLDRLQIICLLARLECHLVAAHDPLSLICYRAVQSLGADSLAKPSLAQFSALALDGEFTRRRNSSAPFTRKRSVVSGAVALAVASGSEHCVRMSLFHPTLAHGCKPSLVQRGLSALLAIFSVVFYSLAMVAFSVGCFDIVSRRQWGLFIRIRRAIAKALAERGKIV